MAPTNQHKVPRFAVIQGGKVLEDRILDKNQNVTIGSDAKNTIVVPLGDLPKTHTILEFKNQAYTLVFSEKMAGKVALQQGSEKTTFADLKKNGQAKKRADGYELTLSDAAKGSVELGEVTLLFQFVTPPKVAAPLALPEAAKGGFLGTIDRVFTGILAAFLLVEFSGAYALSFRKLNDEEITLDELPDRFVKMVVPEKPKEPPKKEEPKESDKPKEADKPKEEKPKGEDKPKSKGEDKPKSREEIAKKVSTSGVLGLLTSAGTGKNSLGLDVDSLSKGLNATDASEALNGAKGVGTANGDSIGTDNKGPKGPSDWNWLGLKPGDVTLPALLAKQGYRTIHVGKGHFAPRGKPGDDPRHRVRRECGWRFVWRAGQLFWRRRFRPSQGQQVARRARPRQVSRYRHLPHRGAHA